jgi:2-desacetyl-2-hydroxyethyl bacteriochlorophyllide A dehydrogenase
MQPEQKGIAGITRRTNRVPIRTPVAAPGKAGLREQHRVALAPDATTAGAFTSNRDSAGRARYPAGSPLIVRETPLSDSHARAFWTLAPGRGAIEEESLPAPGPDELLVETLYSGISRGSEALVFNGQVPPSQYEAMRAPFQAGDFPGPVKYGYASVGRIVAGPDARIGETVFCLHPHQDRFIVPGMAALPVPDGVPAARAVLAANMETAVNATWDTPPRTGDRIAVFGAGVVGGLIACLAAQTAGTRVTLIDPDPERAALAAALGVEFRAPGEREPAAHDLVFEASGAADALREALETAGNESTIAVVSWFGDRDVALPLGEAFHSRRLTLRSSQVGQVAPERAARWPHARRLALALELLADPALDALISAESDFDDLPATLTRLANEPSGVLCHRVRYPAAERYEQESACTASTSVTIS